MRRPRDEEDDDDLHPEHKRRKAPALASVIVEALKLDGLQRLCSSLEPILRRVVSEEVERALAKLSTARVEGRASPKRIEGPDGRNLQLHFRSSLALPLFTGGKVEGEQGAAIHVVLLDANTGMVVTSGPESSSKLDVVVLEGDFNNEDDDNWTGEEFESHVVKEREGKGPLLTGELQVSLKEGVGTLGELTFTDNSSWIRSRKFRLGLKVSSGFCEGIRIREAKTEAFMVKDHRGELYKKHYPPSWKDDVWRLEKIGKDGSFHKKLNKNGINTVEDFLRLYVRDPQRLRKILGSGMSNKMWESLIEHAKTCPLSGKYYVYYSDASRNIGAIFNHIFEFSGLIAEGQFCAAESLSDSQKVFADTLVKKAYENWAFVIEYDGKALLSFEQKKKAITAESEPPALADFPAYDHRASEQHLSVAAPSGQSSIVTGTINGGETSSTMYSGTQMTNYPQLVSSSLQPNYGATLLTLQNQFGGSSNPAEISSNNSSGLSLGSLQHSTSELQVAGQPIQSSNLNSYYEWSHPRITQGVDDFLTEEEIRTRSHQILEHEDMQQLLRNFSMVGGPSNMPEDGFGFQSFTTSPSPFFNFDEDPNRPPGRAVAGWLKIKAAMRWGIFIRKKAAERRRAQLVELED